MSNERCENMATIRRFWPGKEPDLVCVDHAQNSKRIAEAMSFHLHLEPIGYSAEGPMQTEFPTCCCSKGFSQSVIV